MFLIHRKEVVFSTYVEVILRCLNDLQLESCILHVCGGDPVTRSHPYVRFWYSPRMWR